MVSGPAVIKGEDFMLTLKALAREQVTEIYTRHMCRDFAPDELKPLAGILRLMDEGLYRAYGLFEEDGLRGYAMLMTSPGGRAALLDYYAVISSRRGAGYGSRFLALLREELRDLDGIVLESEHIEYAVGRKDKSIRTRRIAFYLRNGVRRTSLRSRLFGVDYTVLYLPCGRDLPDGRLFMELDAIYRTLFPAYIWQRRVEISMRKP